MPPCTYRAGQLLLLLLVGAADVPVLGLGAGGQQLCGDNGVGVGLSAGLGHRLAGDVRGYGALAALARVLTLGVAQELALPQDLVSPLTDALRDAGLPCE